MSKEILSKVEVQQGGAVFDNKNAMMAYKFANFGVMAAVTAASVAVVQSPLESIMLQRIKTKQFSFLTSSFVGGGRFAVIRMLYAGIGPHLSASGIRSTCVTGNMKWQQSISTPKSEGTDTQFFLKRTGYTAGFAAMETAVTQYHETSKSLIKLGLVFNGRSKHNIFVLGTFGIGVRYANNLSNLVLLCILQKQIANSLSFGQTKNDFVAGSLCGVVAGILTTPITYNTHLSLSKVKTTEDGRLITPPRFSNTTDMIDFCKSVGIRRALGYTGKELAAQIPLKMARSIIPFALVPTILSLGDEPLAPIRKYLTSQRFFSSRKKESGYEAALTSESPSISKR